MPRGKTDQSELDQLTAVSASLSAQLANTEDAHVRNAVVHLERAIAELRWHEEEAAAG